MLLYRLILSLAAPVFLGAALLRVLKRTETFGDLRQRLGLGSANAGAIWLHGASNGELTSARPLVEALRSLLPDHPIIVTSNTTSGRDLVNGWGLPFVEAQLAPFDLRVCLALFRSRWAPRVLIVLENELWPNRFATSKAPVICIGARLSEKSAKTWARFPRLASQIFGGITHLSAQDEASAIRFRALGVRADRIGPVMSLKPDVILPPPDPKTLARLSGHFTRTETVLAASTHEGEEDIILAAFIAARQQRPNLKLIIAPRHPRRTAEIAKQVESLTLSLATRSKAEAPDKDVYLADTLGEMSLWYALAGVSFVGGSLCERGGHTPFEPAQAGSAILHGPHVANFQEAYARLYVAQAAREVHNAEDLTAQLLALGTSQKQTDLAERARVVLASPKTDLAPLIKTITAHIR